jgi:hypothetical protein
MYSENAQRVTTKGKSIGTRTDALLDRHHYQNGEITMKEETANNATV